jgi:hypothetical protein
MSAHRGEGDIPPQGRDFVFDPSQTLAADLVSGRCEREFINCRTEHRRNLGQRVKPDDLATGTYTETELSRHSPSRIRQHDAFVRCHVVECPTGGVLGRSAGHVARVRQSLNSCSNVVVIWMIGSGQMLKRPVLSLEWLSVVWTRLRRHQRRKCNSKTLLMTSPNPRSRRACIQDCTRRIRPQEPRLVLIWLCPTCTLVDRPCVKRALHEDYWPSRK